MNIVTQKEQMKIFKAIRNFLAWSIKKHEVYLHPLILTHSQQFLTTAAFTWSNWERSLFKLFYPLEEPILSRSITILVEDWVLIRLTCSMITYAPRCLKHLFYCSYLKKKTNHLNMTQQAFFRIIYMEATHQCD